MARGLGSLILVPQPGINMSYLHCKPESQSLTTREVPSASLTVASHYGLLMLFFPWTRWEFLLLVPCTPGSFLALYSVSPSHTSSVRASFLFLQTLGLLGKMLLMRSVTRTHCALFLLAKYDTCTRHLCWLQLVDLCAISSSVA